MNEHSNRNTSPIVIIVIIVFILILSVGGWYWFMYRPAQVAEEKARLEQLANEKAEQKRKAQAARQQAKYDELIKSADAAFDQENWEAAHSAYAEASALKPDQSYPKDQLVLVRAKLDEISAPLAKSTAGSVESISSQTGRYYIIVSSSLDDDLAMDYANKLASQGNTVKIVEHDNGKHLYYRVALGDYSTQQQAEAESSSFSSYGEGVWVLKY